MSSRLWVQRLLSAPQEDGKLQFQRGGTVTMVNDHRAPCFPVFSQLKPHVHLLQNTHTHTVPKQPLTKLSGSDFNLGISRQICNADCRFLQGKFSSHRVNKGQSTFVCPYHPPQQEISPFSANINQHSEIKWKNSSIFRWNSLTLINAVRLFNTLEFEWSNCNVSLWRSRESMLMKRRNTRWKGENYLVGLHNTAAVNAKPTELGLQNYGCCSPAGGKMNITTDRMVAAFKMQQRK